MAKRDSEAPLDGAGLRARQRLGQTHMSLLTYPTTVPARQSRAEIAEMFTAAGAVRVGVREVSFRLWGDPSSFSRGTR